MVGPLRTMMKSPGVSIQAISLSDSGELDLAAGYSRIDQIVVHMVPGEDTTLSLAWVGADGENYESASNMLAITRPSPADGLWITWDDEAYIIVIVAGEK